MEACTLIQELGRMQMQIAEGGQDETACGGLYDVGKVLSIVGSEVHDESVIVDF